MTVRRDAVVQDGALRSYGRILVYNRSSKSAGTAVGDYLAGRGLGLGLPMSTLITGVLMAVTLLFWKQGQREPSPAMR
jgi:uncharacterized membrane-anchored protein